MTRGARGPASFPSNLSFPLVHQSHHSRNHFHAQALRSTRASSSYSSQLLPTSGGIRHVDSLGTCSAVSARAISRTGAASPPFTVLAIIEVVAVRRLLHPEVRTSTPQLGQLQRASSGTSSAGVSAGARQAIQSNQLPIHTNPASSMICQPRVFVTGSLSSSPLLPFLTPILVRP